MGQRLDLHAVFKTILGSSNVYFQPPPSVIMAYPCIVYNRSNILVRFANNDPYNLVNRYSVTVIDQDPDSQIPDKIAKLKQCRFDRYFVANNLNHYVFNLLF